MEATSSCAPPGRDTAPPCLGRVTGAAVVADFHACRDAETRGCAPDKWAPTRLKASWLDSGAMNRRLLVLCAALAMAVPGCLANDTAPAVTPQAADEPGVAIDESRPDTSFGEVTTGPVAAPDEVATLDEAPTLVPGEWWRLRFDSFLGEPLEVVRVVAARDGDTYLIGMPHEGWFMEAVAYHSPALGDVGLDLSYMTHNKRFEPVKFPLEEGATWETSFADSRLIATVEATTDTTATVVFTTPDDQGDDPMFAVYEAFGFTQSGEVLRLVYDATLHEVSRFESGIGAYEIVEHGYGFEGWVTIPRGHDTAIDYGTFGPANPGEAPLTREIDINGGFNRITLMQAIFPLAPGAYRATAIDPAGNEFTVETTSDQPVFRFFESNAVDGTWSSEHFVAGAGATYSMGIAYHQYDISLPDGARRSDHSHEVVR